VEINWTIHIGFRDGIKTKFGSIPEIAFRTLNRPSNELDISVEVKNCQYIENPNYKSEDNDEEEDEEDENDGKQERKLVILPETKLACS
jgi:hypothetical protein